ncbi:Jag N-terminal domain-containing protein [Sulfurimonas sp. HSL1-6]|uniref:Jag N-terminal domain-containing protein n=1 Tax=Thiomicrolovo immobilis TaxID=3131935 RepID=UPI0031F9E5BF
MKKIEAPTLEAAYSEASKQFSCSVTELDIVVVQHPSKGFLGLLRKHAVIVARPKAADEAEDEAQLLTEEELPAPTEPIAYPEDDESEYEEVYADEDHYTEGDDDLDAIAEEVETKLNVLFKTICFKLEPIHVSVYDDNTLLVEFNGEDAALLIGKEGYRYKALSYMLFNWINAEYQLQLRLEIAEFLHNQEESVARYLTGVFESVDRDGHAQTRVLDGVLVQIALKQLRERYHDKYVAIRTTRDGGKYIIINDYHNY